MQMQQKKIKGFTLLELLVVISIIGIVSTLGFTPFQKWRSDRIARAGAVKVSSVIQDIYSQVQRGHYSFAQFRIHSESDGDKKTWFISSYGMETERFMILVRDKYDDSNNKKEFHEFETRCKSDLPWDDQGHGDEKSKKLTVASYEIEDKLSLGVPGVGSLAEGTVCFSNDGSYYAAGGMFLDSCGEDESGCKPSVIEELYICQAEGGAAACSLTTGQKNFYSIKWSRFGNIEMQKLN